MRSKFASVFILFILLNFSFPRNSSAWYSNPYPYPGGAFDCTYSFVQSEYEVEISILSGSSQQIIWLNVENNTGQPASWQFLDPNQSWPIDYPWQPNRDAETYAAFSQQDSVGFQNGGTGAWVRQIIPDGIYKLRYSGTLDMSKVNVLFQNLDMSWSRPCVATITSTPSPTPTIIPVQSPTPHQSPTPASSTNKVVLIPGFGASWNANAFLNCTKDPNPNNWSLAPYAEAIYNPIITALNLSNLTAKTFYYDWRQEIPTNSGLLASTINNFAPESEKVDIIGHSMGGLIAANYFVDQDIDNKINRLITVGSPLKGVVKSYPAWAGGDIWEDNFIAKVAMTLYLKHCGGVISNNRSTIQNHIPSVKNLLPKIDYLIDLKSKSSIPVLGMNTQNNWSVDLNKLLGIKFKTLTGRGFETLHKIQVKDPNKNDLQRNDWVDGKPVGKVFSNDGDGTVLLTSSKLDEDHNTTINQSHSGLISSFQGIEEIFDFLDTSPPTTISSPVHGGDSMLIIIGYPSNLWVVDSHKNVKKDKNGMVAYTKPKTGTYKINVLPQSSNTLLIVAQFLPNGQVKYMEQNLNGFGPILKTLNFDAENPQEDILN
jgi:pimeloyl-ACP methyl ester carboxylesterase